MMRDGIYHGDHHHRRTGRRQGNAVGVSLLCRQIDGTLGAWTVATGPTYRGREGDIYIEPSSITERDTAKGGRQEESRVNLYLHSENVRIFGVREPQVLPVVYCLDFWGAERRHC